MSEKLQPGMTLPDFELPDENGEMHWLSELQGDDPMILLLGRGYDLNIDFAVSGYAAWNTGVSVRCHA